MANEISRPQPVEVFGSRWTHRRAAYEYAEFYRRDEVDAVFSALEARIALAVERADELQKRLDMVEAKAMDRTVA